VGMKTAVVVMAYGSPSRTEDVGAYLQDIRGGRPVSAEAVADLEERYRRIGGGSPLNEITERQRAALEAELGLPVYVGMKHWTPRISEAAERALADGAEQIVGLVLAPHFSRMSIGGYRRQLEEALAHRAELTFITSYHAYEPFIELLAARLGDTDAHVVFTAHSLPERILADGDPYKDELVETPDILQELERLHGEGIREVLVEPIGFVADHLEIYWDIDIEAREKADELGLKLERTESLNDDPAFIRVLAGVVQQEPAYPYVPAS
jgi:ferrochelatase